MDHLWILLFVITAGLTYVEADPMWPQSPPESVQPPTESTAPTDGTTEGTVTSTSSQASDTFEMFLDNHRQENPTFVAFHVQLGTKRTLPSSDDLIKLTDFRGLKPGQVVRGGGSFELISGTFTAPRTGVYSFTALVNLEHPQQNSLVDRNSTGSYVSVFICIRDDCEDQATLQSSTPTVSDISGVVVTGTLNVEQQQTVSVFIENFSGRAIIVDNTTSFMGYFIHD